MNILITGGTGLVGESLVSQLRKLGHEVRILTRGETSNPQEFNWDIARREIDEKAFENLDCIIHLAGASIFQRWNEANKKAIVSSRIDTAEFLLNKVKELHINLKSFVSASGINYYGTFTSTQIFSENDEIAHHDFLSEVCSKWEKAANSFKPYAERVVILRISPVFSKNGGSFEQLNKITNLNLAAALGSGKQWFPWIHLEDLTQLFVEAIENENMIGPYNAVADEIPTNKELMKKLAQKKGKFFFPLHVPAFALKIALGEMSSMLLEGSRASNNKAKSIGFQFKYPTIDKALDDLLQK